MSTLIWPDIWFYATTTPANKDEDGRAYCVDFRVWRMTSIEPMGFGDLFDGSIATTPPEDHWFLRGTVKWDGCCNFTFQDLEESVMLHICGRKEGVNLGVLLGRIYDAARADFEATGGYLEGD